MGKKYIIEKDDYESIWSIYADKDGDATIEGVSLTPYTAPDLEQVRKEAYEQGWKEAEDHYDDGYGDGYDAGLDDAWKAARKIWEYDTTTLKAIFGEGVMKMDWFMKFTASEAIEKIRQYEQEERFHVGDEFENEIGRRFVILKMDGTEIDRYIDKEGKTYCMIAKYKVMRKTGRHFPEIAEVLQKMKES